MISPGPLGEGNETAFERFYFTAGGLASYRPDQVDQHRQAAGYVDRILKGDKPADLPVQAATKYETAINLKTAKALDLTIPPSLLARDDVVIDWNGGMSALGPKRNIGWLTVT